MEHADIVPFEEVHVWNITRGTRLTTYAIEAPPESGVICANGAAAHLVQAGDVIIIATFCHVQAVADQYEPAIVAVDGKNHPIRR
jgi:aspartate 1-decarboxylase